MNVLKNKSILFLLLFTSISIYGQTTIDEKALHKWFDAAVGQENTGLIDGLEYRELYKSRNSDHKFYLSSSYQIGNISYNGQRYFDIEMKYDIHEDEIIIKIPTQTITHSIQLIKERVESFTINGSKFISINNLTNQNNSFYQVIFKNPKLSLYKKNSKEANKYIYERSIFYNFKNKDQYLLYFKGTYKIIKSRKSIIKLFPDYKKEIHSFYKLNSKLLDTNYDFFMKNLIEKLTYFMS